MDKIRSVVGWIGESISVLLNNVVSGERLIRTNGKDDTDYYLLRL